MDDRVEPKQSSGKRKSLFSRRIQGVRQKQPRGNQSNRFEQISARRNVQSAAPFRRCLAGQHHGKRRGAGFGRALTKSGIYAYLQLNFYLGERIMTKDRASSDFVVKTTYISIAATAVLFVFMLLLTGLHP